MTRVSTDMANDDLQFRLRRQESALNDLQTKIGSQTRITKLRDDPLAAAHAVRYESYLARLNRFESNALYAKDHYQVADGYMRQAQDILQRVREIAVQGGNGVYSPEDLRYMGVEVNELLSELVEVGNAVGPDGNRLFAGDKAFTEPFRMVEGSVPGAGEAMPVAVAYQGAGAARSAEVSEGAYARLDQSGGEAFWAERMQIFSAVDGTDYRAKADGAFRLDGERIEVRAGDTLPALVAKINDSAAPVKASIDPVTRGLVLEGTDAHLVVAADEAGSGVLAELGVLKAGAGSPVPQWNPDARVSGGSAFDMVIRVRDALFRGDGETVGGIGLGGVDLALNNMGARLATLGARQERAQQTWNRLNQEIPDVASNLARASSLDFAQAATDLGMLDFAHKAALQAASKIIQPTMLDYLK